MNVDHPSGFRVARHLSGGMPNRLSRYHIEPALAANIFRGDAVIPTATSKRITRPGGDDVRLQGVFHGCTYLRADGEVVYDAMWPTGQTVLTGSVPDAFVYDDPLTLFEVQVDGAFSLDHVGAFADLVRGSGNVQTRQSTDQIDTLGSGTNLKVYEFSPAAGNEVADNARVLVQIALHYNAGAPTTI